MRTGLGSVRGCEQRKKEILARSCRAGESAGRRGAKGVGTTIEIGRGERRREHPRCRVLTIGTNSSFRFFANFRRL